MCIVPHPLKTNITLILAKVSSMGVIFGKSIFPSGAIILISGIEKIVITIIVKTNTAANFTILFFSRIRILISQIFDFF